MPSSSSRELLLRWSLALGCFALIVFFFSPAFGAFSLWSRVPELGGLIEVRRGVSVLEQAAHPGAAVSDPLHRAIQWRLLFPVIGHLLSLPPAALFGLAYVGCVLVLGYVVSLLRASGLRWDQTALATVSLGACSWHFVSTGWLGYYDAWLALGLLIVAFGRSWWAVWAACLWAPWVDERFVVAAPFALLCRWIATRSAVPGAGGFDRKNAGVAAALLGAYAIVRLGLLAGDSAENATLVGYFSGKNYLDAPAGRILLGVWEGLRSGWFLLIGGIIALGATTRPGILLSITSIALVAIGLATAQDYSRSMTMLLPAAVLGVRLAAAHRPALLRGLAPVAALTLLLPAHHVMNDATSRIFYLYHQLAALRNPPLIATPEYHELAAIRAMEQGDFARAEQDLALAIKLAANPAMPAKQRGVLYASAQRWEEAKRDFTTVIEHAPENPDGWFLRSQVEYALQQLPAARSDFEHAKSLASPEWLRRPDVSRYAAKLYPQGRP